MPDQKTKNRNAAMRLGEAIELVELAREEVASNPTFVGTGKPGSEGLFGPVLHDLRVLLGRVEDPSLHPSLH